MNKTQERIMRIKESDPERASCIENALKDFTPEVQDIALAVIALDRALKELTAERTLKP